MSYRLFFSPYLLFVLGLANAPILHATLITYEVSGTLVLAWGEDPLGLDTTPFFYVVTPGELTSWGDPHTVYAAGQRRAVLATPTISGVIAASADRQSNWLTDGASTDALRLGGAVFDLHTQLQTYQLVLPHAASVYFDPDFFSPGPDALPVFAPNEVNRVSLANVQLWDGHRLSGRYNLHNASARAITAVNEPATLGVLALGAALCVWLRRRVCHSRTS